MNRENKKTLVGICETEVHPGQDEVELFESHGMKMCAACFEKHTKAAQTIIAEARKVDAAIELKTDIFNAPTVAFVELQAAINNDATIPAEKKDFTLVKEAGLRIDKLAAEIFASEQELLKKRNERFAWLKQTQETIGRLRQEEKAQFKSYDINYAPLLTKPAKQAKASKPAKKYNYNKAEFVPMAKKYHVRADALAMTAVQRNITAEAAAKIVYETPAFRTDGTN